jgi:hypothetical protein
MGWLARSRRVGTPVAGVDEEIWAIVEDAVLAAHAGDGPKFRQQLHRLGTDNRKVYEFGCYVLWLLEVRIIMQFDGERPTEEQLHQLAMRNLDAFTRITPRPEVLEPAYRRVFGHEYAENLVTGIYAIIYLAAALGGVVDNPRADLRLHKQALGKNMLDLARDSPHYGGTASGEPAP